MLTTYLALGSNLNAPKQQIKRAVFALAQTPGIAITARSSLYLSKPLGALNQPDYHNAVIEIKTRLSAFELLDLCQNIERQQQRQRITKWAARTIDIDMLFYGDQIINTPQLVIPHPELTKRAFVLVPLFEIAPKLNINRIDIAKLTCQIDKSTLQYALEIMYYDMISADPRLASARNADQ